MSKPSAKQTAAASTLTVMRERIFELVAALKVIALTPSTAEYLQAHDPKALAQVYAALGLTDSDIAAIIAAPRPGVPAPLTVPSQDFVVTQDGSVFHFDVQTADALAYVRERVSLEAWQWLGGSAFAVDHRLAPDLCYQLREDGWAVVVR